MQALLRRLIGDKQWAGVVLDAFLQDLPREIQSLVNVLNEDGLEEVELQAHKNRGAAGALRPAAKRTGLVGRGTDLDREFRLLNDAIVACRANSTPAR